MWSLLLAWTAAAALVRKSVQSDGEMVRTEQEGIGGIFGSTRHSVCGQRRNRQLPYSTDFEHFSEHYAHKVEAMKAAIKELRTASMDPARLRANLKSVDDRMDGFLKCAEIPESAVASDSQIRIQIMDDPRTGYKAMARWAAAHMFAAIYKQEEDLSDASACHLDGAKLEYVLRTPAGPDRARIVAPEKDDDYETYDDAIAYVFQPTGCMDAARADAFVASTPVFTESYVEFMAPSTAQLAFEAVRDTYGLGEGELGLLEGEDEAVDWDSPEEQRPDSPGRPPVSQDGDEDGDYPSEGGVQPLLEE